jgi:carboxyl-terminal processing protease
MMLACNRGVSMSMGFPDPCITIVGPAAVVIPYMNMALHSMALGFSVRVSVTMMPGLNMAARIIMTNGMEPAPTHPLFKGSGGFTVGNLIVSIDFLPAVHLMSPTNGNNFNNPAGSVTVPSLTNVFYTALGTTVRAGDGGATASMGPSELEAMARATDPRGAESTGLALEVDLERGRDHSPRIRVIHVRRNSPAAENGVQRGDELVAVDGSTVEKDGLAAIEPLLSPPVSEPLAVSLRRPEIAEPMTMDGLWAGAEVPSARGCMLTDEIGYVEINLFAYDVPTRVHNEIVRLREQGLRALVVDLRANPGGDSDAFVRLADDFLERGATIATITDGDGDETVLRARQADPYDLPLVLLVDGSTASAAELFAGSLQANGRALLVGETTHGKATAQQVVPHPEGRGAGYATVATYALPGGTDIDGAGLRPDIPVAAGTQDARYWRRVADGDAAGPSEDAQLGSAVAAVSALLRPA